MTMPSRESCAELNEDKYQRIRSAPPQVAREEESTKPFLLCNPDGKPITVNAIDTDSEDTTKGVEGRSTSGDTSGSCGWSKSTSDEKSAEGTSGGESSESESISMEEFASFMMVERLIEAFPALNDAMVRSRVAEILAVKERTPIEFPLILRKKENAALVNEKIKALKEKKDTSLEKIRNEFNRVTEENLGSVIANVLATKVARIDEMKEMAMFVFEKATTEPVYQRLYIMIVGQLKKVWKCTEEEAVNAKQTCFFGTLRRAIHTKITGRHDWSAPTDTAGLEGDRAGIEAQLEDLEARRLAKKRQALGSAQLLTGLYCMNIIGPTGLVDTIETLVNAASTPENVELIADIIRTVSLKLAENNREEVVHRMVQYLRNSDKKHGGRIDFIIERAISVAQANCPSLRAAKSSNPFATLVDEEEYAPSEPAAPTEEEVIQRFVLALSSKLARQHDDEDLHQAVADIKEFLSAHPNDKFFTAYFAELVSNYKSGAALSDLFFLHLKDLPTALKNSLRDLKSDLAMLFADFPIASLKYAEFICHLRGANMIDAKLFESIKSSEFVKKAENLRTRWKEAADPRLAIVFPQDQ